MIRTLSIQNYALIEELEMNPSPLLNIITGETGAGKSIMLGAVGLLLGNRADIKVLFDADKKCIVEGVFDLSSYKLQHAFEAADLDYEEECVIRREISPAGKSRAFINDTPTNLSTLKHLGGFLMDIHSQHESLQLGDNQYQLAVVDAFAAHPELRKKYVVAFKAFTERKKTLHKLQQQATLDAEELDYKRFLLTELEEARLDGLDQQQLEEELSVLENAEEIKLKLSQSNQILEESEFAVLQQLADIKTTLAPISTFSEELKQIHSRLESTTIELQDISQEILRLQDQVIYQPERIQTLKEQLDAVYKLEKKHNTDSVAELIALREKLSDSLFRSSNLDQEIIKAEKELAAATAQVEKTGSVLSESRKLAALNLADEIEKIIKKIGIENGTIDIKVLETEANEEGIDLIEMHFSGNKGVKPQELKEVASGGEFSRLIFAVKYLIADKTALPTIIFDEIDTGVSGQVALQMIQMMKQMAKNHQVISISHLPQFAAGGDTHYFVYKDHTRERSVSKVKELVGEERVQAIAEMIGGAQPKESAVDSARELLQIG